MKTTIGNAVRKVAPDDGENGRSGVKGGRIAIHELPIIGSGGSPRLLPTPGAQGLPAPQFPRHPEKCGDVEPDPKFLPRNGNPYRTRVTVPMVARALRDGSSPMSGRS